MSVRAEPLAHGNARSPSPPGPVAISRPKKSDVLLHYCFDQSAGETKAEHCPCEGRGVRVPRETAEHYVLDGLADWLRVRNARAKKGFSDFPRAIVIRSTVVDGARLFAVPSPWQDSRPTLRAEKRRQTHERAKTKIRCEARAILSTMLRRGAISSEQFNLYQDDAALDDLFHNNTRLEDFRWGLTAQGQRWLREQFIDKAVYWWNNILAYEGLGMSAGTFMPHADHGKGLILYKGDSEHIEKIQAAHEKAANKKLRGRVAIANHKPSFWNGAWDHSRGTTPAVDFKDEDAMRPEQGDAE